MGKLRHRPVQSLPTVLLVAEVGFEPGVPDDYLFGVRDPTLMYLELMLSTRQHMVGAQIEVY